jgi:hypothetical protein
MVYKLMARLLMRWKSFFKPKPHFVLSLPVIDELIGEMFRAGGKHIACVILGLGRS